MLSFVSRAKILKQPFWIPEHQVLHVSYYESFLGSERDLLQVTRLAGSSIRSLSQTHLVLKSSP